MKIYIVMESKTERMIRFVTLSESIAKNVCNNFHYLGLFMECYEPIEQECHD
jgi:hypothetical protein